MGRGVRLWLLALAVLFAQHAAQLHAVSHFAPGGGKAGAAGPAVPAGGQGECLALDTLGCALSVPAPLAGVAPPASIATSWALTGIPRATPIDLRCQSPPRA